MREVTLYTLKAHTVVCHGPEVILSRSQFDRGRVTREGDRLEVNVKEVACTVHDIHRGRGRNEFLAFDPDILPVLEFLGRKELTGQLENQSKIICSLRDDLALSENRRRGADYRAEGCEHRERHAQRTTSDLVDKMLAFTGAPLYRRLFYALKGKLP